MIKVLQLVSALFIITLPSEIVAQKHDFKMKNIEKLTDEEKHVIISKGTEKPFSGKYNDFYEKGNYYCKACDSKLYESSSKFKSNCGWPSFDEEVENAVKKIPDRSLGMNRIEIVCANCNGHLGHVFYGEYFTKKNTRHCVNSLSLKFVPDKKKYNE